jgi:long-chain acyl-CoA synthetase
MHGTLAWPLEHAARPHGDRLAVIDGSRRLTYRELHDRVRRLGAGLETLGLAPGAVVGALLGNSLEHLEAWLAVPAHGRVLNTLNTRLAVPELVFMLDDCGTEVLVVDAEHLATGRELRSRCPGLRELVFAGAGECPPDCVPYAALLSEPGTAPPDLDPDTLASISYTGGTTGRPKGVMLSHANLLANSKHLWHTDGFQREDRYLHAGPMFHGAASQMVHPVTWVGATHVMLPRFTPDGFARQVGEHGVTVSVLVPTMIAMLLDHLERHPADLSSLRLLHYGASPMSADALRRAMRVLGCEFLQGYGMTEAGVGATWLPPQDHRLALAGEHPERLASVGYAIPGVQVEIRDLDSASVADGTVTPPATCSSSTASRT